MLREMSLLAQGTQVPSGWIRTHPHVWFRSPTSSPSIEMPVLTGLDVVSKAVSLALSILHRQDCIPS